MKKDIKTLVLFMLAFALVAALPALTFAQGKSPEKEKGNKKEMGADGKNRPEAKPKDQPGHEGHNHGKGEGHEGHNHAKGEGHEGHNHAKGEGHGKADEMKKVEAPGADSKGKAENPGNAYGRNIGEMSGREFGQNRAAEARSKHQTKKAETRKSVETGDSKVVEARDRIKKAKEKLEKDKKAKRVNDKQYEEKKKKIEEVENQTNELEKKIKMAKPKIEGQQ